MSDKHTRALEKQETIDASRCSIGSMSNHGETFL
jgi:hypothetical protein